MRTTWAPLLLLLACTTPERVPDGPSASERARNTFHRVMTESSPRQDARAQKTVIPSPLAFADGRMVTTASEWYDVRRPQLVNDWTRILGKIEPNAKDSAWFPDARKVIVQSRTDMDGYTEIDIDLPLENDLYSRQLLLLPKGKGPFPVVVAWSSTNEQYRAPVEWWGQYLVKHGFAVLTGRPFIGYYREGTRRKQAAELVYARFGHWLPMGKMVHDLSRQIEYLQSRPDIDCDRIGFIGFSMSAKAALYIAAFNKNVKATVAIDPHVAMNGGSNWYAPYYMDWQRKFDDIDTPEHTVLSLLDPDTTRAGFEHDHQELLALAAPRAFLLIGGSQTEEDGIDSDDMSSWGYVNRAREVYQLLGVPERLRYVNMGQGHLPSAVKIDTVWQSFLQLYLKDHPIEK